MSLIAMATTAWSFAVSNGTKGQASYWEVIKVSSKDTFLADMGELNRYLPKGKYI